jgi:hypothetical protein
MDKRELIDRRRKRYLAQTLELFETRIVPHLPKEADQDVTDFKATVRRKMNALAVDACEVMELAPGEVVNAYAVEQKDRIFPHGRP